MSDTGPRPGPLTPPERAFLREVAWAAVTAGVHGLPPPDPWPMAVRAGLERDSRLAVPRGAFVTLRRAGLLRGCLGHIEGTLPLVETVLHNARAAALSDPRFAPLTPAELPGLSLEISALTPLRPVQGPDEITVGQHGILLAKRGRRAVFLPQVATEQGWDLPTTLSQLALKAGLSAGDWHAGARFEVFEAEVF